MSDDGYYRVVFYVGMKWARFVIRNERVTLCDSILLLRFRGKTLGELRKENPNWTIEKVACLGGRNE